MADCARICFARSLLTATLTLLPVAALATDASDFAGVDLYELELADLLAIRVNTASRYQESMTRAPAAMSVIEADEINRFGGNSLYEVLERVVGVYMTGSFFFPQNGMAMRGDWQTHADNHVLILLNGQPLRESYSGGINFPIYLAFPLQSLARIEVIRGPGSVLYGSNAYSGVINLITKTKQPNGLGVRASAGSFASSRMDATLDWSDDNQAVHASLFQFHEAGWDFAAMDNAGVSGSKNYGEDNLGAYVRYQHDDWQGDLLYVRSEQDFWGATASWAGLPEPDGRRVEAERWFAGVQRQWQQSPQWWLDGQLNYGHMQFEHYNYGTHSSDLQLGLTEHWQPNANWHGLLGLGSWWQDVGSDAGLQAAPVADIRTSRQEAYVQLDYLWSALKLTAGWQYNTSTRTAGKNVPRYGAVWEWNQNMGLKLMHASAYRSAYAIETDFQVILHNPDGSVRGGLRGNPNLAAETVTTTDLQWYHVGERHQLALTAFRSREKHLIARVRAPDRVIDFVNQGELLLEGYELESKYQWSARTWLSFSYSEQHNESGTDVEDFTTVPNRQLKLGLDLPLAQAGQLGVFAQRVSAPGDIAVRNPARRDFNGPAKAYTLLSANWRLNLSELWPSLFRIPVQLQVYGYNLLNESIEQPDIAGQQLQSLPARAGRSYYLGLAAQF